ncbi:MAG: hypothetical protein ACI9OJ_005945 [Myxococcota bacterium]|jgi:hypothetical protein
MAMTTCRDCEHPISDRAAACVGCGAPRPASWWSPRGSPRHGPGEGRFLQMMNSLTELLTIAFVLSLLWLLFRS